MISVIIRTESILGDSNSTLLYKTISTGGEDHTSPLFNITILLYSLHVQVMSTFKIITSPFSENFVEKLYNSTSELLFFKGLNRFLIVYEGPKS